MIFFTLLFMFTDLQVAYIAAALLMFANAVLCIAKWYRACHFTLLLTAALVFSALLFYRCEYCVVNPSLELVGKTVCVSGTLLEPPQEKENSTLLHLDNCVINGEKTDLKLYLYCKNYDPASAGDEVSAEAAEIFASAKPGEFYYHTLSGGTWLRAYSREAYCTGEKDGGLLMKIRRIRSGITGYLVSSMGDENGGIAAALLTGDRDYLDTDFRTDLHISGASHLFAVSGMHLSIWSGVIFLILKRISRLKKAPYIATVLFVLFYMTLTGFSPSVLRAGIMLITVCVGKLIRRQSDPLNSLCLSAVILLTFNIYLAGNVSFLLSFFATFAIITLYPMFSLKTNAADHKNKLRLKPKQAVNVIVLSLSVMLVTAPISGFYFGSISLLSPISSLLCSLPVECVMITSFLALSFSFIPVTETALFSISSLFCTVIRSIVHTLSRYSFYVLPVHTVFLLLWYLCTGAVMLYTYIKTKSYAKIFLPLLVSVSLLLTGQCIRQVVVAERTEIFIPSGRNSTNICIRTGSKGVLLGVGKNYEDLEAMNDYLNRNGVYRTDAVIVPRVAAPEADNLQSVLPYTDELYTAETDFMFEPEKLKVCMANCFTLDFCSGFTYENHNATHYSAGVLNGDTGKIVFCYYPASDFSDAPEILTSGDYLICRGDLPKNLPLDNFCKVIVLTDKTSNELLLPPGIETSADTGDIRIIFKNRK